MLIYDTNVCVMSKPDPCCCFQFVQYTFESSFVLEEKSIVESLLIFFAAALSTGSCSFHLWV